MLLLFRSPLYGSKMSIVQTLPVLNSPFVVFFPRLNLLSSSEVRQPGKAPNYSVNWTVGCTQPEIIDAMKGKEQVRYKNYWITVTIWILGTQIPETSQTLWCPDFRLREIKHVFFITHKHRVYIYAHPVNFAFVWVPVTTIRWWKFKNLCLITFILINIQKLFEYRSSKISRRCNVVRPLCFVESHIR